jgi:hypothetical protein
MASVPANLENISRKKLSLRLINMEVMKKRKMANSFAKD